MLLRTALSTLSTLRDSNPAPGLIAVAVVALCEAVQQRLQVPNGTPEALWAAVRRNPTARWTTLASEALGELATPDLVSDILQTLRTESVGVDLVDAALDALSGPAAAKHVSDHDLADVCERAGGRLVYAAARLVQSVCDHRPVPQEVVAHVANAWLRREKLARLAALDLLDLLPREVAQRLVQRALEDDHRSVRSAAALKLSEVFGPEDGLAVVKRRQTVEADNEVLADLLRAEADLVAKRSDVV